MSDERKEISEEELISINTAVFQSFLSSCNYKETSKKYHKACQQIRLIIEYYFNHLLDEHYKKPEIDDMKKYIERKLEELIQLNSRFPKSVQQRDELNRNFITQIIKDAKGRGK